MSGGILTYCPVAPPCKGQGEEEGNVAGHGDDAGDENHGVGHGVPVIEKYKLHPIKIFDKNCPLKRVNQKFAIFWQNVRKLELFW